MERRMNDLEEVKARMVGNGYIDAPPLKSIAVGDRIRHSSHQWPDAFYKGTATVLAIMRAHDSYWEKTYGSPDIELIVQRDDGSIAPWANYHAVALA
jgi:hypothetical protein